MPTDKEVMQQALDALINAKGYIFHNVLDDTSNRYDIAIEAIRTRLSQCDRCGEVNPAEIHTCTPQEPVAWFCELPDNKISIKIVGKPTEGNWEPLYAAPPQEPQIKQRTGDCLLTGVCAAEGHRIQKPQREWQGLTDDEIKEIVGAWGSLPIDGYTRKLFDQIEAKLKEKNA